MALFNYATRELSAKVVYYGPGLSGKTTNIEKVHELLKPGQKGKLISLPTETDRTLFFDFLPVQLGKIKGFNVRFHLYTVPGQVFYNATRRLVLQGVDGVVFVADSQEGMKDSNLESLRNLEENLASYGKKIEELPFLIQFNKRDLKKVQSVEEMNASLNRLKVPTALASALTGEGVIETLSSISRLVFRNLRTTLLLPGESAGDEVEEKIGETFGTAPPADAAAPAATAAPAAAAAPAPAPRTEAPRPPAAPRAAAPPSPPPPPEDEAEPIEELEEIADIEEIGDARTAPPPPAEPFPARFGEAIPFPPPEEGEDTVPDEVDLDAFASGASGSPPIPAPPAVAAPPPAAPHLPPPSGGDGYRFAELDEIEVSLPTPESLAPPVPESPAPPVSEAAPPPAVGDVPPPAPEAPPAPAGEAPARRFFDTPASPSPPPSAAPAAPAPDAGRSPLFDAAATLWGAPAAAAPALSVETEEGASLTFLRFDAPTLEGGGALLPMVFLDGDGNRVRIRLRLTMEGQ
jgi:signal recognition particle receptor subunit beta